MVDETITIQVDDAEVQATVDKIEEALGKKDEVQQVQDQADQAQQSAEDVAAEEPNVRGTSLAMRRIMMSVPEVREVYHLMYLTRLMIVSSPYIAAILMAWMAARSFFSWIDEGVKQAKEYRQMVMKYQHLTSFAQFNAWMAADKKNTQESYRSAVPQ